MDGMVLSLAMAVVVTSTDDLVELRRHSKGDLSDRDMENGRHLESLDCGAMRSTVPTNCLEVSYRSENASVSTTNRTRYPP